MIISLYDADMAKYHQVVFNLELMKISTYYKSKREIVNLSPKVDLDKYSKLFYRKDYYDGSFDAKVLTNSKVVYGGRAFYDRYIPLDDKIERVNPDKQIYESMRRLFVTNNTNERLFNQMMRAQHIRLSLDGTTIWDNWESQLNYRDRFQTYIFHDYNLNNIKDAELIINNLLQNSPNKLEQYVGSKFPIITNNYNDLQRWITFKPMAKFYNIEYHNILTDEELYDLIQQTNGTSIMTQGKYCITDNYTSQQDFVSQLPHIYQQIVFLRNNRINFPLYYNDKFFENKMWCKVLDLIIHYYTQGLTMSMAQFKRLIPYDSLYSFVANFSEVETYQFHFKNIVNQCMTKNEAREIFQFVKENNYELFKAFYECKNVVYKGGVFQYD